MTTPKSIVKKTNLAKESGGYVLVNFSKLPAFVMHQEYYKQLIELLDMASATQGTVSPLKICIDNRRHRPGAARISRQVYHKAKMAQLLKLKEV